MMIPLLLSVLPLSLKPSPPFPPVLSAPFQSTTIAPGLTYGEYALTTARGPLVIHVLDVAPHHPELAFDTVVAHDTLTSSGETVSSIAHRSDAVAALNGDYFDIGATNQPVNVVANHGELLRTPRKRAALVIANDGHALITETAFTGHVQLGGQSIPLTGVNEMLPPGGQLSLLTPQYGPVAPSAPVELLSLRVQHGTAPFATYSIVAQADNLVRQPPGYYLAVGPNAATAVGAPGLGTTLVANGTLSPIDLNAVQAAIGGGPLIVRDGAWFDDVDGPRGGSYDLRAPQSGAALLVDGTLLLVQIDGRQPDLSIGVTPHEFAELMIAFGAVTGMEFDSGGSSQMNVRIPGDVEATVVNSPSDGRERPISDALVIRELAPVGPAARIASVPQTIRALPNARIPLKLATIDNAEHRLSARAPFRITVEPANLGEVSAQTFVAKSPGTGSLVVRSDSLVSRIPVTVAQAPAKIVISPQHPSVPVNGRIELRARAYDASGFELSLPALLPWRVQNGAIAADGMLSARNGDALVSLALGDRVGTAHVSVGYRDVSLPFASGATFRSIPKAGAGSVTPCTNQNDCIVLKYSLGPSERAAYAVHDLALPANTVGMTFDVEDDNSNTQVKVALHNAIDEEVLLQATILNSHGWKHVEVPFPATFAGPGRITAIYAIAPTPGEVHAGAISIRNVKAVVAGSE